MIWILIFNYNWFGFQLILCVSIIILWFILGLIGLHIDGQSHQWELGEIVSLGHLELRLLDHESRWALQGVTTIEIRWQIITKKLNEVGLEF